MTTLIRAARLADSLSTSSKANQAVLVTEDRIQAVGSAEEITQNAPPGTETVDLGDATLTPGLIDGHTHLSLAGDGRDYAQMFSETDEMMVLTGARNLQLHLAAGITTLREHGARNKVGFILKEGIARGYIVGPRMQVSGRPITCTGGHFHMCNEEADGPDEIRRSVRRLVHEGADYLKIMASGGGTSNTIPGRASYSVDELHAAVHEAHHFHKLTAAHCRAKESMQRAVEAGIDLMEHAEFLDPDNEMRFDPDLADKMAECGTWISPTLQAWTKYGRIVELQGQRTTAFLNKKEQAELQALESRAETRLEVMRRMLDHCKMERIVPGTDSGVGSLAFGHLDYDLRLLVQAGFTPGEALLSATSISAAALGLEQEIGTIEVGKIADLAAFKGDPTEDVLALSEVVAVFQSGVRVL
ncbi:MAG: amidohydrolase family protein [Candidatus Latescibacterota bacterium]|nr:amidohydrolase family protein [Candidatus Latescibacterota bacterium]